MSGNKAGGIKTRAKNLAKDPDFYKRIGALGGKKGKTGGFASKVVGEDGLTGPERAKTVGFRGGKKSKRRSKKVVSADNS